MGKKKKKRKELKKRRLGEVNIPKKKKQDEDEIEILKEQVKRLEITVRFMERNLKKIELKQLDTILNNGYVAISCENIQKEMDVIRKVLYEKKIISASDFVDEENHTMNP